MWPDSNATRVRSSSPVAQLRDASGPRRLAAEAALVGDEQVVDLVRPDGADLEWHPLVLARAAASDGCVFRGAARAGTRRRTRGPRTSSTTATTKMPPRPPPGNTTAPTPPRPRPAGIASRTGRRRGRAPTPRRRAASRLSNATRPHAVAAATVARRERRATRARSRAPRTRAAAREQQRAREHPLLAHLLAQERRDHRAEPVADRARDEHEAEDPRRLVRPLQRERGEEREEADDAAQQAHRGSGDDDARARAAPRARRRSPRVPTCLARGMPNAHSVPNDEHERARAQHPRRADASSGSAPRSARRPSRRARR